MTPPLLTRIRSSHSQEGRPYDLSLLGVSPCGAETESHSAGEPLATLDLRHAPRRLRRTPYTRSPGFHAFLIAERADADIWLQKLDWIARHGGMALVNVHPDYLCLDGATPNRWNIRPLITKRSDIRQEALRRRFLEHDTRKSGQFFADATKVPRGSEA
jgi:hypothetical protein